MGKILKLFNKNILFFLLVATIPSILALAVPGYYGASDDLHIGWLYEMDQAIKTGQIPPRYVPDLSFGFGYPLFNFVFPLPFYLGELFHLIGLNFVDSVKLVFALSFFGSALSMYLFLRKFSNKTLSALGSLIYVYTPYRSTDVYDRGAIGEALSFVFLPLIGWSVTAITTDSSKEKSLKSISLGALSVAGLVLTHNITTYMFLPFVFLLGIMQIIFLSTKKLATLIKLLLTFGLGLSISLYFWLPALIDSSFMKDDTVFNFVDHFPTIQQLITPYWGYGASVPGPGDGISFFIGVVNLLILIIGAISLIIFRKRYTIDQKVVLSWAAAAFLCAFFMMNYRSSYLWQVTPFLSYFQFPWRFLIITTFVTPIFILTLEKTKFYLPLAILTLIILIPNIFIFHPHDFLGRQDSYYINRYIPNPIATTEYQNLKEEYLRLPNATITRPDRLLPTIFNTTVQVEQLTEKNPLNIKIQISSDEKSTINFNKYFFPGWVGKLDGREIKLLAGQPYGQIEATIPAGSHTLEIFFTETNFKIILDLISLGALVVCFFMLSKKITRSKLL